MASMDETADALPTDCSAEMLAKLFGMTPRGVRKLVNTR